MTNPAERSHPTRLNETSNALYVLPPVAAAWCGEEPLIVGFLAVCWAALAVGSWGGHRYETDLWWRADVTGMLMAISSLVVVTWEPIWGIWGWPLPVLVAVYYAPMDSFRINLHVGAWAGAALLGLAVFSGWLVLPSLLLFGCAVVVRLYLSSGEDVWHILWHLFTAAAGTMAQPVVLESLFG